MFIIVYAAKMQFDELREHPTPAWSSPRDEGQAEHREIR